MGSNRRPIIIRCDGDSEIGLGHVVRCVALADELRDGHGFGVVFAMARGTVGLDLVRKAGYPVERYTEDSREEEWLQEMLARMTPAAVVLDIRNDLSRSAVETFRKQSLIVAIDDPSDRRLAADLVFYPPVPQVRQMDWTGFTGKMYSGWEWVILRRQFLGAPKARRSDPPIVLVTMGGSDPSGLTLKAIKALEILNEDFEAILVLGPGFSHRETLNELLSHVRRRFQIRENVTNMAEAMAGADLAVASFSVTAYELAAAAVPAIYFCLTRDHEESASVFAEAGIGVVLGVFEEVGDAFVAEHVKHLLGGAKIRHQMAQRCRRLPIGSGTRNIAQLIAQTVLATSKK